LNFVGKESSSNDTQNQHQRRFGMSFPEGEKLGFFTAQSLGL
jgi:hypothetical protein